jgi:hypothetical protein
MAKGHLTPSQAAKAVAPYFERPQSAAAEAVHVFLEAWLLDHEVGGHLRYLSEMD